MKKKINMTLDEEVIKKVKELAKERHSNFSATINQLLWEKVDERITALEERNKKWDEGVEKMGKYLEKEKEKIKKMLKSKNKLKREID